MTRKRGFDCGTTSSALLRRVRDTEDRLAWESFVRFYSPLLRQCCRRLRLDPETADEVSQRVWSELVVVMPAFSYRQGLGFRRWLWSRCRSRAVDLLRKRDRERQSLLSIDESREKDVHPLHPPDELAAEDEGPAPLQSGLLHDALEICKTVRHRVHPRTWQAFWHVTVDGWTVRETSDALKMTYAAVFVAQQRVERKLRDEGERRFQG